MRHKKQKSVYFNFKHWKYSGKFHVNFEIFLKFIHILIHTYTNKIFIEMNMYTSMHTMNKSISSHNKL